MFDRSHWHLRGPVRTLRISQGEWNRADEAWGEVRLFNVLTFHADGQLRAGEHHNPDGSVAHTTYRYDDDGHLIETHVRTGDGPVTRTVSDYEHGRLVRTETLDAGGNALDCSDYRYDANGRRTLRRRLESFPSDVTYGVEAGSGRSYSAPGAVTLVVEYDAHDRPFQAVFRDRDDGIVRRIAFTRDAGGRLLREEVRFGDATPFPRPAGSDSDALGEERARLAVVMSGAFTGALFATVSCAYDDQGRLTERLAQTGQLSEERETFAYDERGNTVEQVSATTQRQLHLDDRGSTRTAEATPMEQRHRFAYVYDAHDNWTERAVSSRHPSTGEWRHSSIERRELTYEPARPIRKP